jgi:hypothetical protein
MLFSSTLILEWPMEPGKRSVGGPHREHEADCALHHNACQPELPHESFKDFGSAADGRNLRFLIAVSFE